MRQDETPSGTLCLAILKLLARGGELRGCDVARRLRQVSGEVLPVEDGSLYPALRRMPAEGLVKAKWAEATGKRPGAARPPYAANPKTA